MKSLVVTSFILSLVFFVSCKNESKNTEPEVKTVPSEASKQVEKSAPMSAKFEDEKLNDVFATYIQLKTALVNTNAEAATEEASQLMTAFANVGADDMTMKAAQNIVESDDVEVQRTQFVAVTTGVEALLANTIDEGVIYKQYCPMAFNNTGAYWLSESKEIRNPYFGDKMLKCGRIDAELK